VPTKIRYASPLAKMRAEAEMSREQVARYAGVSMATVKRLEQLGRDAGKVVLGDVVKVADALGCSPLDIVPGMRYSARAYRHREALVRGAKERERADALLVERGAQVAERSEALDEPA
jgi:transcriptional regulator with XRE-family HTH domain